jgi:glyoxylase-like metal-dependent hydrolase (beta-lactamase superfamily II)
MNIGKFSIEAVETGLFSLDGGAMFGVVPKVMWSKSYHPGDELNRIPLQARPLLVRWEGHIMLIDNGNGTKFNDKFASIYKIDRENSSIEKALEKHGVKPEDITDVLLTHLHFDHAGGSTRLEDGKAVPAFPNAYYYVQKEHLQWAKNPTEKDRASFIKDDFMPLEENSLLVQLDGPGTLFEGIDVIPHYGHTEAMQLIKISDGGQTLLYCADLCPTAAHIPVPFVMGYDNFPLRTIEEKKRILPQAYEEGWVLAFEHDAFTQAVRVQMNEKGGFMAGDAVRL